MLSSRPPANFAADSQLRFFVRYPVPYYPHNNTDQAGTYLGKRAMTDIDTVIKAATQAMCEKRFKEAGETLCQALETCSDLDQREIILQQLVHLYENPLNQNLEKAQSYMAQRETLNPSAYAALANAYFHLHSAHDDLAARQWSETSSRRAVREHDQGTLYSSTALTGLLAARQGDQETLQEMLERLVELIDSDDLTIRYGDAVPFLESLRTADAKTTAKARLLAGRIAVKIEDPDFHDRASAVAKLAGGPDAGSSK